MRHIKRFAAVITASVLLAGLVPSQAFAALTHSNVNVTSYTTTFDAAAGESATVNYSVFGPDEAENVTIFIYKASSTSGSRQCNNLPQNFVTTIEGPVNRGVGLYSATWTGRTASGTPYPTALYCFQTRWGNPLLNSVALIEGGITLNNTTRSTGGTGTGIGTGSTGTGTGSTGTGAGTGVITDIGTGTNPVQMGGVITANVDPSVINPTATEGNAAYITYTVNQNLTNGFTLKIYDSGGFSVKDLYASNQFVRAGTRETRSWNGRRNDNQPVTAGDYFYKFRVDGQEVATGLIRVERGSGSGGSQADIIHYVVPVTIDPTANPPQTATVYYTVNRRITTGLTIVVRSDATGSLVATLMSITNQNIEQGAYYTSWNGHFNNNVNANIVPEGAYRYALISNGQQISSALIHVTYGDNGGNGGGTNPPPVAQFVTNHSATPGTFTPSTGQSTTIAYTLGKSVTNFMLSIRNASGSEVARLETSASKSAGSYSMVWSGIGALAGAYNYVLSAAGENPVSGNIFVADSTGTSGIPTITDLGALPNPFNTATGTTFRYLLNQNACVDFTILNGSLTVRRLLTCSGSNNAFAGNTNQLPWDGRNDLGQTLSNGTYTYFIEARNSNGVAATRAGNIVISSDTELMDVTNVYVSPSSFNPNSQNTLLYFTLNQDAYVNVAVTRATDGAFVRTLASNQFYSAGSRNISWNGRDQYGAVMPNGNYSLRVDANNSSYGNDYGTATATVTGGGSGFIINHDGANPNHFDPHLAQTTAIDFYLSPLNTTPSSMRVNVFSGGNTTGGFVREVPVLTTGTNFYRAQWNGKDQFNNYVANGTYTYRIEVTTTTGQSDQVTGTVYVSDGTNPPPPPPGGNCGNFWDVPDNHRLCDAIEFVASRGIFVGYNDGSLGLDKVIQRAQLLAVVQKAFQFPLDTYNSSTDRNLGFSDLRNSSNKWYMPYIKTFSRRGLMVGYPDNRFRPEQTMNTAELYLVFLKSALHAPRDITNFELPDIVRHAPFIDVSLNSYYLKYAAFAKLNDLVITERFYPARGITRGQVIQLIYDMYRKGLINYPA